MLSKSLSGTVTFKVLTSLICEGFLTDQAIRVLFINMVNATFDEENVSPLRKINCIKAVRRCMTMTLKESKDLVERFESRMVSRQRLTNTVQQFAWDDVEHIPLPVMQKLVQESSTLNGIDIDALKQAVIEELIDAELSEI